MPKQRTHKGSQKRFKRTGSGKVKRSHAKRSHMFANKTQKQKRQLRKSTTVSKSDLKRIAQQIAYLK